MDRLKRDLIKDAFRALLRAKPELRRDVAVEFIKISVPSIPVEEIDNEVERILEAV